MQSTYRFNKALTPCCCHWRRAKNITNKPRINEDPKDAMLREFQEEIMRLKAALAVRRPETGRGMGMGMAAAWGWSGHNLHVDTPSAWPQQVMSDVPERCVAAHLLTGLWGVCLNMWRAGS